MAHEDILRRAAEAVRSAGALLIGAGAGMGVDSGLPDFRGREGFWRAYPAVARLGLSFEQLADPSWFDRSPGLAWAFYGHRLNLYRRVAPHAGFLQLLRWAAQKPHGAFVFTSNVDGHFQKAGFDPDRIVECHGSIHHFQCCQPCQDLIWDAPDEAIAVQQDEFRALQPWPACRVCGQLARPNVLMFGDGRWLPERTHRQQEALAQWLGCVREARASLVILEFGAGTGVPSVRHFTESVARNLHGVLVRVNPRESQVPPGQIGIAGGALETIRAMGEALHREP